VAGSLVPIYPPLGVAGPLVHVWAPWGHGRSFGPHLDAVGSWLILWSPSVDKRAWPVLWLPSGCRGGVVGLLVPVWPLWRRGRSLVPVWLAWERGRSPAPRLAAVKALLFPWFPCGRRWAWPIIWSPSGCRQGVDGCLVPVGATWGRGRSPDSRVAAVWRGQSSGHRLAAVKVWPVAWSTFGRRGGVAASMVPVWPPWGCGRSTGLRLAAVGACPVHSFLSAAVGAWPVPWSPSGRRGGAAGPLVPIWLPWGRGQFNGDVCRQGGVAGPLVFVWPPWVVAGTLVPVWPPRGRGRSPGPRVADVGRWQSPGPRVAAVAAWPIPCSPCGNRRGVAGPSSLCVRHGGVAAVRCVRYPAFRVAAIGAWPVH